MINQPAFIHVEKRGRVKFNVKYKRFSDYVYLLHFISIMSTHISEDPLSIQEWKN